MLLFGLGKLFYVAILLVNAVAILSEDRFLARIGWGNHPIEPSFGSGSGVGSSSNDAASVKAKIINLISSVRTLMRIPLIVINTLVIIYEVVLG